MFEVLDLQIFENKIVRAAIIVVIAFLAKIIINRIINSRFKSSFEDKPYKNKAYTIISTINNVVNFIIFFIAITQILAIFNINTASILAVAGVGGMALAFAANSLIADFISGAFILLENQFNLGDTLTVGGVTATVTNIGLRTTKLVDFDGKEVIIPNGEIKTVVNHSLNQMRAYVKVFITGDTEFDKVEATLNKVCQDLGENRELFETIPTVLGVEGFTELSYSIGIQAHTKNGKQFEAQRLLRKEVIKALQREEINFSNLGEKYGL